MECPLDLSKLSEDEHTALAALTRKTAVAIITFFENHDLTSDIIRDMEIMPYITIDSALNSHVVVDQQTLVDTVRNAMFQFRRQKGADGEDRHQSTCECMRLINIIDVTYEQVAQDQQDRLWYDGMWANVRAGIAAISTIFAHTFAVCATK